MRSDILVRRFAVPGISAVISWLSDGTSTVSGHWNWVGESSHGWIYRKIDDYRPASLIIGYVPLWMASDPSVP